MKRIGITGPTGAGKTTALSVLSDFGVYVVDADAVYHRLLSSSSSLRQALVARFGRLILAPDGTVDRKALGRTVFADPTALSALNTITHRFILDDIDRQSVLAAQEGRTALAIDAIALIESGVGKSCDTIVGILAPKDVRIRRIMAREGISEAYARQRVEAQQGDDFFRAHCDYILENQADDTPESFQMRAHALFQTILG